MQKFLAKIFLKIIGWKITGEMPAGLKKCVLIAAPHTSGWDFLIGRAGFYSKGVRKIKFLIKKEMFKFPLGGIIKSLGAIPVDRSRNNNAIIAIGKMFSENENFLLMITPEGTRKYTDNWKKGFYHIAETAGVPIVLTYVDYGKKEGGIGPALYPSGNYEEDFKIITDFYKSKTAKFPENFNLSPQYNKN
jgi:1-acyl-sn-glycerol-3-phosphate acyltransferase